MPVEGAIVHVKPYYESGGAGDILYSLRTDESGLTDSVLLPAPPRELSQAPEAPVLPYAEYNVTVFKDGYRITENIGVPVFDGISSVQTVNLIPLAEGADGNGETVYYENESFSNLNDSLSGGAT